MYFCKKELEPSIKQLLMHYGIQVKWLDSNAEIPGSWFGEPEAGIIANQLYVREDTPVHSALHESCHYICMDSTRRQTLDTNAGGDYTEENGVCFLQILLADHIAGFSQLAMMKDMDDWGYTFRLGSARRWFYEDAEDASEWLIKHQIIDKNFQPTWKIRQS